MTHLDAFSYVDRQRGHAKRYATAFLDWTKDRSRPRPVATGHLTDTDSRNIEGAILALLLEGTRC
jgi:hypothetical protein